VVAVPPIIQYVSAAATIVSYVATGKGTSDHVISVLTEQDCALHRALFEAEICFEDIQTIASMLILGEVQPPRKGGQKPALAAITTINDKPAEEHAEEAPFKSLLPLAVSALLALVL
jgi:hypothetical protein